MKNKNLIEEVSRSKMLAGVITQKEYNGIINEMREVSLEGKNLMEQTVNTDNVGALLIPAMRDPANKGAVSQSIQYFHGIMKVGETTEEYAWKNGGSTLLKIVNQEGEEVANKIRGIIRTAFNNAASALPVAEAKDTSKYKERLEKWLDYDFESSCSVTKEFSDFARDYKRELKKVLDPAYSIIGWSRGHFCMSGFIKNAETGKLAYISTSDVRGGRNGWYNSILVRSAKHDKDWTGGGNCFTNWQGLIDTVGRITAKDNWY